MDKKTIRESYTRLLEAFENAGVKLNESQKTTIDGFVDSMEKTLKENRELTILATKNVVTRELDKEYRKVFESILGNLNRFFATRSKIMALGGAKSLSKSISENKSEKIVEGIDRFLDKYVQQALPKKVVIDYNRIHKLEKIVENLKSTLVVTEDTVEEKQNELKESFDKQLKEKEDRINELRVECAKAKLGEQKALKWKSEEKTKEYLIKKCKDLPKLESKMVQEKLEGKSIPQIDDSFDDTLKDVQEELQKKSVEDNLNLEREINDIVNADDEKQQESKNTLSGKVLSEIEKIVNDTDDEDSSNIKDNEKTQITQDEDEDKGGLPVGESIDSDIMKVWINRSNSINTNF